MNEQIVRVRRAPNRSPIGIGERGKNEADLRVGEGEFLAEDDRRRADIDAIDVGNEVHEAQKPQYTRCRADPHLASLGSFYSIRE